MSHQQHADNVEGITPYCRDTCKHEQVQQMFDNIAASYDRLNAMMTFGMYRRWLRSLVSEAANATPTHVLDIATGTGDVALALAHKIPQAHIDGIDLSQGMLDVAAAKISREASDVAGRIVLKCGDALALPYYDSTFDVITVAYGVRNFDNLARGYTEMYRVLRPGGKLLVLELSTPSSSLVRLPYKLYVRCAIPTMGRLVSKDSRAYHYLPESVAAVPAREDMCRLMTRAGMSETCWREFFLGVCTLYTATKPCQPNRNIAQ